MLVWSVSILSSDFVSWLNAKAGKLGDLSNPYLNQIQIGLVVKIVYFTVLLLRVVEFMLSN